MHLGSDYTSTPHSNILQQVNLLYCVNVPPFAGVPKTQCWQNCSAAVAPVAYLLIFFAFWNQTLTDITSFFEATTSRMTDADEV